MKKKILIITTVCVAILGIAAGIVLVFFNPFAKKGTGDELLAAARETDYINLLKANTVTELREGAASVGVTLTQFENEKYWGFQQLTIDSYKVSPVFEMDDDDVGKIEELASDAYIASAFFAFSDDDITGVKAEFEFADLNMDDLQTSYEQIKYDIRYAAFLCGLLFETDFWDSFTIYHNDGRLLKDMTEAYTDILKGDAMIYMMNESGNGSWEIRGFMAENRFVLCLEKNLASDSANIGEAIG